MFQMFAQQSNAVLVRQLTISQNSMDQASLIGGSLWDACVIDTGAGVVDACISDTFITSNRRAYSPFIGDLAISNLY